MTDARGRDQVADAEPAHPGVPQRLRVAIRSASRTVAIMGTRSRRRSQAVIAALPWSAFSAASLTTRSAREARSADPANHVP